MEKEKSDIYFCLNVPIKNDQFWEKVEIFGDISSRLLPRIKLQRRVIRPTLPDLLVRLYPVLVHPEQ